MEGDDSLQWYDLCGAVLRGIAANHNKVELVLHYNGNHYPNQHPMSQLARQGLKNFEVVERKMETYFISKPHTPTGEVVCVYSVSVIMYCSSNIHFVLKCTCMYIST